MSMLYSIVTRRGEKKRQRIRFAPDNIIEVQDSFKNEESSTDVFLRECIAHKKLCNPLPMGMSLRCICGRIRKQMRIWLTSYLKETFM